MKAVNGTLPVCKAATGYASVAVVRTKVIATNSSQTGCMARPRLPKCEP